MKKQKKKKEQLNLLKNIDWVSRKQFVSIFIGTIIVGGFMAATQHVSMFVLQDLFKKALEVIKW